MIERLLKDSAVYGLAGAAGRFASVLLVPIYTRVFTPAEYGQLDLILTISVILVLLSGMQVESGVARSYYEAKEVRKEQRLVGTGLLLYIASGVPCMIIFALIFQFWLKGHEGVGLWEFIPMLFAVLPTQFFGYGLLLLRLEWQKRLYVIFSLGDLITSMSLTILVVAFLHLGVPGVLWAILISKVIWSALILVALSKYLVPVWDSMYAREILAYSLPTVPTTLVGWFQNYGNRFILLAALSFTQVGVYSLAVKTASIVGLVITAFLMAWYPYSIEIMGKPGAADKYARVLDYYLISMFFLCATVGVMGNVIVKFWSTDAYQTAGSLVGFIAMGLLWSGAPAIAFIGVEISRKTYLLLIGLMVGTMINLATLFIMIDYLGLVASGMTYLLGAFVTVVINLAIAQRQHYIPYRYHVVLVVAGLSCVVPTILYFTTVPTASWSVLLIDTALKLLAVCFLCLVIAIALLSRPDRKEFLHRVTAQRLFEKIRLPDKRRCKL